MKSNTRLWHTLGLAGSLVLTFGKPAQVAETGIQRLELDVQDAGDGTNSDWGVWFAPELRR